MKNLKKSLSLIFLSSLSLTSCSGIPSEWADGIDWAEAEPGETTYKTLTDKARKAEYKTYYSYMPNSWNTATTFQAEDAYYLSNVVDSLIEVDQYNRIVPALATEVPSLTNGGIKVVDDHYEITLTIKDDVWWVENDGFGEKKVEKVKAEDFVTAMKINLNFASRSNSSYLPQMFLAGASDYYYATYYMAQYETAKDKKGATNAKEFAAVLLGCTTQDIDQILTFEGVGVKADGNKVTYILTGKQEYFLSVLTYTPFLPVPTDFYNAHTGTFGKDPKNILSCGAYVVDGSYKQGVSKEVILNKNLNYYDKNHVMNGRVHIMLYPEDSDETTLRKLFESGTIDAFGVDTSDIEGVKKYITGESGKGTILSPDNKYSTSIDSPGEGSTMAYNLNTHRTVYKGSLFDTEGADHFDNALMKANNNLDLVDDPLNESTEEQKLPSALVNTNLALSYSPKLREAVLTSLDYSTYWVNNLKTYDSYQDRRLNVNTYTPHGFITTDEPAANGGHDYVDFLKEAWVNERVLGKEITVEGGKVVKETYGATVLGKDSVTLSELVNSENADAKAYAQTLINAAQDLFSPGAMGLYNLIPAVDEEQGKFTGFAVESTEVGHYDATIGKTGDTISSAVSTGAALSGSSEEGESETWYKSRSRDTAYLSKLVSEGIAEAQANLSAAGINWKIQTPIIIEAPTLNFSNDQTQLQAAFLNRSNANINGGKYISATDDIAPAQYRDVGVGEASETIKANDAQVLFVQSTKGLIPDSATYSTINSTYNCTLLASGWIPDYSDAKTYADTVRANGDLSGLLGLSYDTNSSESINAKRVESITDDYQQLIDAADAQVGSANRARGYAAAEIDLLFDNYLLRPLYNRGQGITVQVRRTLPKGATTLAWGLNSTKLKGIQVFDETLTSDIVKGVYDEITAIRNAA